MHRFFADENGIKDGIAVLDATDSHHASKVLRMGIGDEAVLIADRALYRCKILSDAVSVQVLEALPSPEPEIKITLYQGLPKADKMDFIVQKATELGVNKIVPVSMERCVVKLDGKDAKKKQERWQKIAREAAKQSGRAVVPEIALPLPLKKAVFQEKLLLVPWEEAAGYSLKKAHADYPDAVSIGVLIGPEGGITEEEIKALPFTPVTLGKRILRTETAGLCALSALYALYGDLE
jgi:RNA methyltransferase, RsmE family